VTVIAQVRESKSVGSPVVRALTATFVSNVVTVGAGDNLDGINPGIYHWSLQITNATYASGLTPVSGTFRVLSDSTEVIV